MNRPSTTSSTNTSLSWQLHINVNEFKLERNLRVSGDMHIGGLMLKLVDSLNIHNNNWSDYALWWQAKKQWLIHTKYTLDQYGIQANDYLLFTRIHKQIKIEMPDQQQIEMNVDFSINCFNVILYLCKELGIRHAEELSLLRHTGPNTTNQILSDASDGDSKSVNSNELIDTNINDAKNQSPLIFSSTLISKIQSSGSQFNNSTSTQSLNKTSISGPSNENPYDMSNINLALSPIISNLQHKLKASNCKYKNLNDKAKINNFWLDSSKSLMEQDINENDLIKLRFKYFAFLDINSKTDLIRINQIYEQAKWAILTEQIDCTDEELFTFAALQLQIQMQTKLSINNNNNNNSIENKRNNDKETDNCLLDDDVDAALNKLEKHLEEESSKNKNQTIEQKLQILNDEFDNSNDLIEDLQLMKHKYTFKKLKTFYFHLHDTYLSYFKNENEYKLRNRPIEKYNLKNCEVIPDLNMQSYKYGIYLKIPDLNDGLIELYIRCPNDDSYARWLAAFKLASKNKTLNTDMFLYKCEIETIKTLIEMQKNKSKFEIIEARNKGFLENFDATNYAPLKLFKKLKIKQVTDRIIEIHSNLSALDLIDAKLRYIKAWQALPDYGISYFAVKFKSLKSKDEFLGITSNRMIRYNNEFNLIKTWRLNSMKSWNVNWDTRHFEIEFDDENVQFYCINNLNPKILHEFIGGYIFMSLRNNNTNTSNGNTIGTIQMQNKDKSTDVLDQELFFKLTDKR